MQEVELRVWSGNITVPYRWTPGPIYGRFLGALKDNKIQGVKCSGCFRVYVPPSDLCPVCFSDFSEDDLIEVEDEGIVTSYTIIETDYWPPKPSEEVIRKAIAPTKLEEYPLLWRPDIPYALVAVKLKGADTNFLHIATGEDLKKLKVGAKVKAVWREDKQGDLFDLERFEVID